MKITYLTTKASDGVFAVRGVLPIKHFLKRGHEVEVIEENGTMTGEQIIQAVDWADVVVLGRNYLAPLDFMAKIILYAKQNGKKVIYDTDDLLINLFPDHPAYHQMKPFIPQIRLMARTADLVTVTGEGLKREYGNYNQNIAILPNCIDPTEWKLRKGGNKKLRIGWAGTLTHISDLLIVLDALIELQKTHKFEFVVFGLMAQSFKAFSKTVRKDYEKMTSKYPNTPKQEWYVKFEALDAKLAKLKWTHVPFVPLEKYKDTLSELNFDIGLCPLEDNRFNACKSPIKFYEYAMVGTVTVASKVSPYQNEVMFCAKNRYEKWYCRLKLLLLHKELRESVLAAQREYVLRERTMENNIKDWENAYSE